MNNAKKYHPFELQIKKGIYKYKMPKSTFDIIVLICKDYVSNSREYDGDDSLEYVMYGCTELILIDSVSAWLRKAIISEVKRSDFGNAKRSITEIRNSVSVSLNRTELAAIVSVISSMYMLNRIDDATMSELSILSNDIYKVLINGTFSKITQYQKDA